MIGTDEDGLYDAARFPGVLTGGKWARTKTGGLSNLGGGELLEYVLPDGTVLARKVMARGETQCWLAADVAERAQAARAAEAAEHERVRAELAAWMDQKDAPLAAARGLTIEKFREQRNYSGMRFDRYRAAQRSGS